MIGRRSPPPARTEDMLASKIVRRTAVVGFLGASDQRRRLARAVAARGFRTLPLEPPAASEACDIVVAGAAGEPTGTCEPPSGLAEAMRANLHAGQLIIMEAAFRPGTVRQVILPALESSGLAVGRDFFFCLGTPRSGDLLPHRDDAGGRLIGGVTPACLMLGRRFYGKVLDGLVTAESVEAAELVASYLVEFARVNAALVERFAADCRAMGLTGPASLTLASANPSWQITSAPDGGEVAPDPCSRHSGQR